MFFDGGFPSSDLHSCGMGFTEPQVGSVLVSWSLHEKGIPFLLDAGVWKYYFFQRTLSFIPYLHDNSTFLKWKNEFIV